MLADKNDQSETLRQIEKDGENTVLGRHLPSPADIYLSRPTSTIPDRHPLSRLTSSIKMFYMV
jgi:hypothetical protein